MQQYRPPTCEHCSSDLAKGQFMDPELVELLETSVRSALEPREDG